METRDLEKSVKEFFCVLQKKSAFLRTEIGSLQAGNDVTEKRENESFNVIRKRLWDIRGAQNMFFVSINSKKCL